MILRCRRRCSSGRYRNCRKKSECLTQFWVVFSRSHQKRRPFPIKFHEIFYFHSNFDTFTANICPEGLWSILKTTPEVPLPSSSSGSSSFRDVIIISSPLFWLSPWADRTKVFPRVNCLLKNLRGFQRRNQRFIHGRIHLHRDRCQISLLLVGFRSRFTLQLLVNVDLVIFFHSRRFLNFIVLLFFRLFFKWPIPNKKIT